MVIGFWFYRAYVLLISKMTFVCAIKQPTNNHEPITGGYLASIVSPFVAAILASLLSYSFATRTKRKEILYQNRIEAFKLIAAKITSFKKYCSGKIAMQGGHEFSPYQDEEGSGLTFRTEIAHETELNQLFLTKKSRKSINYLLGNMSMICNAELHASSYDDYDYGDVYKMSLRESEACLETLYDELNLS